MIKIKRVETKRELKQFVQFYYDLYRGCDSLNAVKQSIFWHIKMVRL